MNSWTEKDFESLSWHDSHVHGFSIVQGDDGCTGQLVFDLDFIVQWIKPDSDKHFRFLVAPATLTFHGACDLRIALDYMAGSVATVPFTIGGIEREIKSYPNGYKNFRWRMPVNFPKGEISFEADGFTQALRTSPIESTKQWLMPNQRAPK